MSTPSLKESLKLNTPRRTPDHKTKSHVVKVNDGGTEKLIRFGQQGVKTAGKPKDGESQTQKNRRKSFKARHGKNIAKGPTSAAYWANKVKWAEGGEVELDLGMDERDFQRAVTKETSNLADYNNDGRIDSLDALAVGYDLIVPTDPREIGSNASDALKLMLQQQYLPAAALGTAALLGGSEYVPMGGPLLKGITRPIRQALKKYDPNIVENRAEEIIKGVGSGDVAPKVPATPKSKDVKVTASDTVSDTVSEEVQALRNRWIDADGGFTKEARDEANRRAAKKIDDTESVPLSKFLEDNVDLKGGEKVKLIATESDRSATSIGGGPGFSKIGAELSKMADEVGLKITKLGTIKPKEALEILENPTQHPVWGVFTPGVANSIINRNLREESLGTNVIWTTLLGTDIQLLSNPVVFDDILVAFKKAVIDGKLPKEQAAKMNHNLKLLGFPDGADVRDPQLWDLIEETGTFVQRKNIGQMAAGNTVELEPKVKELIDQGILPPAVPMGGKKSAIVDVDEIIARNTEPGLTASIIGDQGGTIGNYGFKVNDNTYFNKSIHEGYPQILEGRSLPGSFKSIQVEDAFPDLMNTQKIKYDLRSVADPSKKTPFSRGFYGMAAKRGQAPIENFKLDLTKKRDRDALEELKKDPEKLKEAIRLQDEFNRGVETSGRGLPSQNITQAYVDELKKKGMNKGGTFDEFEDEESSSIVEEEMDRIFSNTSANTEEIEIQEIETSKESPSIIRDFIDNIEFTGGEANAKIAEEKFMLWDGNKLIPTTKDMARAGIEGGFTTTIGDNVVVDISGLGLKGLSDFNDTTVEGTPITGGITYIGDGDNRLRFESVLDPNERELINANLSGSYNMGDNRLSGNINYDPASGNITNIVGELQRMLSENSSGYGKIDYDPINEKTSGKVGYEYRVPNTGSRINVEGSVDPYRDNETKVMANFTKGFNRGGSYDADKINMMADQILETYNV